VQLSAAMSVDLTYKIFLSDYDLNINMQKLKTFTFVEKAYWNSKILQTLITYGFLNSFIWSHNDALFQEHSNSTFLSVHQAQEVNQNPFHLTY